jgi:GGDEF domain-containing protein
MSADDAIENAKNALLRSLHEVPLAEPMLPAILRAGAAEGSPPEATAVIDHWLSRSVGNPLSSDRYRWELTHRRGTGMPEYAGAPAQWTAWRPSEQAVLANDVFAFEERLCGPIVICESLELLAESAPTDARARELLEEAEPVSRRDFAAYALERNAWVDTFGLWCLVRYPRTLERLRPIAVAISESYALAARRDDGIVCGTRYPLHQRPLVSATAQLASSLLALGSHADLIAKAARFTANEQREDGGFGDFGDPSDVLTTLAAAEFLATTTPEFEPMQAVEFLIRQQEHSGFWRALGPEMPWLTRELANFLRAASKPFGARFRFPRVAEANLDRKTRLPAFAYFAEIAALFSELPGIATHPVELSFIDLIGFREFNNKHGQAAGDRVLHCFGEALSALSETRVIRDGGDEFLVLGAPGNLNMLSKIKELQATWPARFREHFPDVTPLVLSRVVTCSAAGRELVAARESLGRAIGELKHAAVDPEFGVLKVCSLA